MIGQRSIIKHLLQKTIYQKQHFIDQKPVFIDENNLLHPFVLPKNQYLSHFHISLYVGFLPYINIPMRYILAAMAIHKKNVA